MPTKSTERHVLFFDVIPSTWHRVHDGLPAFPMLTLIREIDQARQAGDAQLKLPRAGLTIYVTDVRIDTRRKVACCLINVSDRNAADPAFSDVPHGTRRIVAKRGDEGLDTAAHVMINLQEQPERPGAYRFLLEVASNVPSTRVERFLNRVLKRASAHQRFLLPDPEGAVENGTPVKIKVRPILELRGIPSSEFLDDLRAGTFSELELLTYSHHESPWDSNAYAIEDRKSVYIKANPAKPTQKALAMVKAVLVPGVRKNYEQARIKFLTPSGLNRMVRVFSDDLAPANDRKYVRKEILDGFRVPLPASFDQINDEIYAKMLSLL